MTPAQPPHAPPISSPTPNATAPTQIGTPDMIDKLGLTAFSDVVTMTVLGVIAGLLVYAVLERVRSMSLGSVARVREQYREDEQLVFDLQQREQDAQAQIESANRQAEALDQDLDRRFPNRNGAPA